MYVCLSSMEGVVLLNIHPIIFLSQRATIGCPTCQHMYLHTSVHSVCTYIIDYQHIQIRAVFPKIISLS